MNILIITPDNPDRYKVHYPFVKQLVDEFEVKFAWVLGHPETARRIGARGKVVALQSFDSMTETKKLMDVIMARPSW